MPSSQNPSRETAEIEEVPDDDELEAADDPSRRDGDDELEVFDDELVVEEIELDEMPSMEGPDA